jgi:hypothetical protein
MDFAFYKFYAKLHNYVSKTCSFGFLYFKIVLALLQKRVEIGIRSAILKYRGSKLQVSEI